ncbi:MAG: hypothetical protein IVW54_16240 [Candidatus Binataceae bacterium]|nr:hypothetical protein [Candidatus Binataceae bacterium]
MKRENRSAATVRLSQLMMWWMAWIRYVPIYKLSMTLLMVSAGFAELKFEIIRPIAPAV